MKKSFSMTLKKIRFVLRAEKGRHVFVAGTFNNWNPTATPLTYDARSRHYQADVQLLPGLHEYKFIVDGVWCVDPECSESVPNELGDRNSVIHA